MMLNNPEMVLLDVDGTLVDTVPDLAWSINCMLGQLGLPQHGENKVRGWVGNGLEVLIKRALTDEMDIEPDPVLFERARDCFIPIYTDNTCRLSKFYDGVVEGLEYLKQSGYKLGCVTNKRGEFTRILLEELGIYDAFGIVIAGDTLPRKKPDPLPLLHAAEHFGVDPEKSLMIGDSVNDVYAARAAGFQVLAVSYGYNHGRDIGEAEPDAVIDSLACLPELLAT